MAKNILAWNEKAQQFYREIGNLPNSGRPHRFYLTDNKRAARANVVRLEGVWQGVKDRWNNHHADDMADTVMPLWDDTTIQIGTAVGKGLFFIDLDPPDDVKDDDDLATWIAELRDYFPQIQVRLKPDVAAAAKKGAKERLDLAEKEAEEEQSRHRKTMRELRDYAEPHEGKIRTQETLHDALDAYVLWLHQEHRDHNLWQMERVQNLLPKIIVLKEMPPLPEAVRHMRLSPDELDEVQSVLDRAAKLQYPMTAALGAVPVAEELKTDKDCDLLIAPAGTAFITSDEPPLILDGGKPVMMKVAQGFLARPEVEVYMPLKPDIACLWSAKSSRAVRPISAGEVATTTG